MFSFVKFTFWVKLTSFLSLPAAKLFPFGNSTSRHHFFSASVSLKRILELSQQSTIITYSRPLWLIHDERQGPAVYVIPVFIPIYSSGCFFSNSWVFYLRSVNFTILLLFLCWFITFSEELNFLMFLMFFDRKAIKLLIFCWREKFVENG